MSENHGIGKKEFAREYAKALLCLNEGKCLNNNEASQCDSCIKFTLGSNPDYTEIKPDGKVIKIEQIRKMQEKISEKPIISDKKIYIIDDADLMTEESQNCLLKTLEEPPEYAVIILIVSNESKILATNKSRCVILKFDKLTNEEIKSLHPNLSEELIELLEGSLEKIEGLEEKQETYKELNKIVDTLEKGSLVEVFNASDLLYTKKDDIINMLEYLNLICFKRRLINAIEIIEKTKIKIVQNNNYDMCIDYLLMHIWEEIHEKNSRY